MFVNRKDLKVHEILVKHLIAKADNKSTEEPAH